jgi:hypothetical protein
MLTFNVLFKNLNEFNQKIMKKVIVTFIAFFIFSLTQATPIIPSLNLSETAVLTDLELNKEASFIASKEMPGKKRANRRSSRKKSRRKKEK